MEKITFRQNTRYRSYLELIARVPLLRHLLEQGENDSTQDLYQNVSNSLSMMQVAYLH